MKPIFIALLEHGEDKGLDGTSLANVLDWAQKNDYLPEKDDPRYNEMQGLLRDLFFESFAQNSFVSSSANSWGLKAEYFYRLLEYRELHEARENSRKAQKNALIAISISIFALVASVSIGYMQLSKPVEISERQISKMIDEVKLSSQQTQSNEDKNIDLLLKEIQLLKTIRNEKTDSKPEASNKNKN
jgi:hypothetical protein